MPVAYSVRENKLTTPEWFGHNDTPGRPGLRARHAVAPTLCRNDHNP